MRRCWILEFYMETCNWGMILNLSNDEKEWTTKVNDEK